jgi:hypothetical protein
MTWDTLKQLPPRRSTLGAPPAVDTTIGNLTQPESVPVHIDGRSLRATGRTEQLNLHVRPDFKKRVKLLAVQRDLLLVEILEQAFEAFEKANPDLPDNKVAAI